MKFDFVYIYRHIYKKWLLLVDPKYQNTIIILTGLTILYPRKCFLNNDQNRVK